MPDIHIVTLMINTTKPEALAEFWSAFLDVPIEDRYDDQYIWLGATKPGAPRIAFQRVDDPTAGTRRLHADFAVPNVADAIAKAVRLGATQVDSHAIGDFTWQVMRDPEGNEFCLAAS
jgi:predicted enzyme related to lactoylglutathione lyase